RSPSFAPRGGPLVARAHLPDPAAGDADRRSAAPPGDGRARARRRGVPGRRGALPPPRSHAAAPRRRDQELDPPRPEPREDGHQGRAALLYLLPPLRLPHGPRRLQPRPSRWRRRLFRGLARGAAALPAPRGGVVRARARAVGAVLRSWGRRR